MKQNYLAQSLGKTKPKNKIIKAKILLKEDKVKNALQPIL
jgi:hypothetical protein